MFLCRGWRWGECAGNESEFSRDRIFLQELCEGLCGIVIVKLVSRLLITEMMELGPLCRAGNHEESWMSHHPQQKSSCRMTGKEWQGWV